MSGSNRIFRVWYFFSLRRQNYVAVDLFFSQPVVKEWNLLLQEVVDATSVNDFKNRLDKFCQRYAH